MVINQKPYSINQFIKNKFQTKSSDITMWNSNVKSNLNKKRGISRREKCRSQAKLEKVTLSKSDSNTFLNPYQSASMTHLK